MQDSLLTAALAFGAALLSLVPVLALARYLEPVERGGPRRLEQKLAPAAFLFEGERLVDATPPARALLARLAAPERRALLAWLEPRLPGAPAAVAGLAPGGRIELEGTEGRGAARLRLTVEDLGAGLARLTLVDPRAEGAAVLVDTLSQAALEEEAAALREVVDRSPALAWRETRGGEVVWANAAYLAGCDAGWGAAAGAAGAGAGASAEGAEDGPGPAWSLPHLFDLPWPEEGAPPGMQRRALETAEGTRWFDCEALPSGSERLVYALPADDAVRAERSLREFVQTLTKTFADLPIGLAIFDRKRNLQLFNPALIDLTGLPTSFLTARPALFTLLDRLREARMVPEPRDYRSWRRQMSTLEAAAASGHHVETWSLPGGQTYRVTGRPHPDGALAFLFEDITSEMSLTRRFRAQLSLGTQVVDALDEALAVFGADGQMLLANDAWRRLWGEETRPLGEHLRLFEASGSGGAGAARLAEHLARGPSRGRGAGALAGPDGRLLAWRATPLPGGQVLLGFTLNPASAAETGEPPAEAPAATPPAAGLPPLPPPEPVRRGTAAGS